ncbi:hypothetical protein GRS48_01680 [Halorubrum sp. JWXQ-INN 858]|uniref:hypothetical protein n=1 Tax=Halorubrum sp. JWXQ-INN 858 TaxID=2690782 RepID=UPI0013583B98|nr:hypothetical protein [Halorubrum sp. JWXQ-INN 858]MWV63538.1 hypothetical protein [Halorubrum sp. JWXQ-INN 858]
MPVGSRLSVRLADFGSRSLVTHALMGIGFVGAVVSGLFVEGDIGVISMVAFINFTAGLWISQSIHSLGNAATDDEYNGVLMEVLNRVS